MLRRSGALLAAVAALALAAGCGDDDGDGGTTSSAANADGQALLTKAEFLEQGNAICKQLRARLPGEVSDYFDGAESEGKSRGEVYARLAHSVVLPVIETQLSRLYYLGVPAEDDERVNEVLYSEKRAVDELALTERIASAQAIVERFKESERLLRSYGLGECANGPGSSQDVVSAAS